MFYDCENRYGVCGVLFLAGLRLRDFKKLGLRLRPWRPHGAWVYKACPDSDSAPLISSDIYNFASCNYEWRQ